MLARAHADQRAGPLRGLAARPGPVATAAGLARRRRQRRSHPADRQALLRLRRAPPGRSDPDAPTLRCQPQGPVPLPPPVPEIAWRAGLDLSPLDLISDDDARWLSCLVWPGEGDREQRLAAAIDTARRAPPAVHRGDLLTGLPALAAQAPPDTTLVIYHCSVLYQLAPNQRAQSAEMWAAITPPTSRDQAIFVDQTPTPAAGPRAGDAGLRFQLSSTPPRTGTAAATRLVP